ncbi:hypothetical protein BC833DRAFT_552863 [Globomyces pollinis-pini]|nr:hypothetical protein BC833DRAFT_552863 [Globomyces pollinis-pini]KAJ2995069.1 hypothetical protein HDV02_001101 [Globomyces sp. JEL0801]
MFKLFRIQRFSPATFQTPSSLFRNSGAGLGLIRPYSLVKTTHKTPLFRPTFQTRSLPTFTQLSKEYGLLALGIYSIFSFSTFCGCYYYITSQNFTGKDLTKLFNKVRTFFGLETEKHEPTEPLHNRYDWLPAWTQDPTFVRISTNVLLAMGMTKLFAPIKIGLTALIVPGVSRKLKALGWIKTVTK